MLAFRRLDVIVAEVGYAPNRNSRVLVSWELVTQHSGLELVSFSVERSMSPAFADGEINLVASDIVGEPGRMIYEYVDITANLFSFWRLYFYRIRADTPDGIVYSQVRTWESNPRPHELAIIERHDYVLRFLQGKPSFIFVERTADAGRCICWNPTAGRSADSRCTLCLGTGRQRPYFAPIPLFIDYNPDEKLIQMSEFGKREIKQKDCWFSAFPIVKPGDIVYEIMAGNLWRINRVNTIQPMGTTVQQICRLGAIDRGEVEYRRLTQQVGADMLQDLVREWELVKAERMF
jgi:hypothetical protein